MFFQILPGLAATKPATMPSFGLQVAFWGMSVHPGVVQNAEYPGPTGTAGGTADVWWSGFFNMSAVMNSTIAFSPQTCRRAKICGLVVQGPGAFELLFALPALPLLFADQRHREREMRAGLR